MNSTSEMSALRFPAVAQGRNGVGGVEPAGSPRRFSVAWPAAGNGARRGFASGAASPQLQFASSRSSSSTASSSTSSSFSSEDPPNGSRKYGAPVSEQVGGGVGAAAAAAAGEDQGMIQMEGPSRAEPPSCRRDGVGIDMLETRPAMGLTERDHADLGAAAAEDGAGVGAAGPPRCGSPQCTGAADVDVDAGCDGAVTKVRSRLVVTDAASAARPSAFGPSAQDQVFVAQTRTHSETFAPKSPTGVPRLPRALSMPLSSQLGYLRHPHRPHADSNAQRIRPSVLERPADEDGQRVESQPEAGATHPRPHPHVSPHSHSHSHSHPHSPPDANANANATLNQPPPQTSMPSSIRLHELAVELADSVQMMIQTMLQVSPPQLLDPAKEQFSACALAVPTSSMSAMFTGMKNLNYISAHMSALCAEMHPESPGAMTPVPTPPILPLGSSPLLPPLTSSETIPPSLDYTAHDAERRVTLATLPANAASAAIRANMAPPPLLHPAPTNMQKDFDIGEMMQNVGDSLSGTAAQAGVDLVLYHGDDVGLRHICVKGDESGISYALSHVVRQVLATAQPGDSVELGLLVGFLDPKAEAAHSTTEDIKEGSADSNDQPLSPVDDENRPLPCTIRISHKHAPLPFFKNSFRHDDNDTATPIPRPKPSFQSLLLRRLLRQIGAKLTPDLPPPDEFLHGYTCDFTLMLERGSFSVTDPVMDEDEDDDARGGEEHAGGNETRSASDSTVAASVSGFMSASPSKFSSSSGFASAFGSSSREPSVEQLIAFAEGLQGKKVTLYADTKGSFAQHLSSCLIAWGMDVTHISPNGDVEVPTSSSSTGAVSANAAAGGEDAAAALGQSFVFIDDDVEVLKERLFALREQVMHANLRKRPSMPLRHKPRSLTALGSRARALTQSVSSPALGAHVFSPAVIMHFTSLANYKVIKDVIQAVMSSHYGSALPLPEVMIIPKPAGPRRFLTALHTAVTKPVVDPFFVPIATSPGTPGLMHSGGPFFHSFSGAMADAAGASGAPTTGAGSGSGGSGAGGMPSPRSPPGSGRSTVSVPGPRPTGSRTNSDRSIKSGVGLGLGASGTPTGGISTTTTTTPVREYLEQNAVVGSPLPTPGLGMGGGGSALGGVVGGVTALPAPPASPLAHQMSENVEYFSEAAAKLGASASSGLVIQSPDGQPAGIFFHPRGRTPKIGNGSGASGSAISLAHPMERDRAGGIPPRPTERKVSAPASATSRRASGTPIGVEPISVSPQRTTLDSLTAAAAAMSLSSAASPVHASPVSSPPTVSGPRTGRKATSPRAVSGPPAAPGVPSTSDSPVSPSAVSAVPRSSSSSSTSPASLVPPGSAHVRRASGDAGSTSSASSPSEVLKSTPGPSSPSGMPLPFSSSSSAAAATGAAATALSRSPPPQQAMPFQPRVGSPLLENQTPSTAKRVAGRRNESTSQPRKGKAPASAGNLGLGASGSGDSHVVPPISVLIVDDNPINQTILSTFMKKKKIKYDLASNGQEAVQKWRSGGFHLILMDIQMPIMDGIEATKEIRRMEKANAVAGYPPTPSLDSENRSPVQTPSEAGSTVTEATSAPSSAASHSSKSSSSPYRSSVIIVALTASSLQSDRVAALAAGCNDFLTKPVSLLWLNNKITEWGSIKALQMWADLRPPDVVLRMDGLTGGVGARAGRTTPPAGRGEGSGDEGGPGGTGAVPSVQTLNEMAKDLAQGGRFGRNSPQLAAASLVQTAQMLLDADGAGSGSVLGSEGGSSWTPGMTKGGQQHGEGSSSSAEFSKSSAEATANPSVDRDSGKSVRTSVSPASISSLSSLSSSSPISTVKADGTSSSQRTLRANASDREGRRRKGGDRGGGEDCECEREEKLLSPPDMVRNR